MYFTSTMTKKLIYKLALFHKSFPYDDIIKKIKPNKKFCTLYGLAILSPIVMTI